MGSRRVVLVTGASRGIGLGLVRELLRVGGYQVIATCRYLSLFHLVKNKLYLTSKLKPGIQSQIKA